MREGYLRVTGIPRDCAQVCHNRRVAAENAANSRLSGARNGGWKDGRSPIYYRQFLKPACERCGSTRILCIHHADENRSNSDPTNLVTVCKACHQRYHAEPRRDPVTGRFT